MSGKSAKQEQFLFFPSPFKIKRIFMVLFFGKHFTSRHPPLKKSGSIQPDLASCTQHRLKDCYKSMLWTRQSRCIVWTMCVSFYEICPRYTWSYSSTCPSTSVKMLASPPPPPHTGRILIWEESMGGKEYDPEQSTVRSLSDWFLGKKK